MKNETSKKIDRESAFDLAIKTMKDIRESSDTGAVKAIKERRLGKRCITVMAGRSNRKEENKASLSYFNREVTKLRTSLKNENFIRHDFYQKLSVIIEESKNILPEIKELKKTTYKEAKKVIEATIKKLLAKQKTSKSKANLKTIKLTISKLKKLKFEPVIFETLIRTQEQKSQLMDAANKRVEGYHKAQRPINYDEIYSTMSTSLKSTYDWESLLTGLVLASGRRSAELINPEGATFERTKNNREALFTTRVKSSTEKAYKIPLLVDFETFTTALKRFHKNERVKNLMNRIQGINSPDERHKIINSSIQKQINQHIKETFKGKEWKLKDGRAIYARMAYTEYCNNTKRLGKTPITDDLFFKKRLGHTDATTQQNYKQFVIKNAEKISLKKMKIAKEQCEEFTPANRIDLLTKLVDQDEVKNRLAFKKYADWILEEAKKDPAIKITTTLIKSELGGNKGTISEFVRLIKEKGLQKPI